MVGHSGIRRGGLRAAIAYFCGCFNGAVIVSKYILRDDVRTHGSGNAGLTNFYRTFGGPLTSGGHPAPTCSRPLWPSGCGRLAAVGHRPAGRARSPWRRQQLLGGRCSACWATCSPACSSFKGGKGILSGGHHRADDGLADCPGGLGRLSASWSS